MKAPAASRTSLFRLTDRKATVTCTLVVKGRDQAGNAFNEIRELRIIMIKVEGDWLFEQMERVDTLQ